MINKIKGLRKYTDCSMPSNEEERLHKAEVSAYNQAIDDVVKRLQTDNSEITFSDIELNIGDDVITNIVGYEHSPFHNVKGVVVEITGNDYLIDMAPNGNDFVNYWKNRGNLYGCDWNENIKKTCKWFEKQQLIKV